MGRGMKSSDDVDIESASSSGVSSKDASMKLLGMVFAPPSVAEDACYCPGNRGIPPPLLMLSSSGIWLLHEFSSILHIWSSFMLFPFRDRWVF